MVGYSWNGIYILFPLPSRIFHKDTFPRRQISREITCIQFRRIGDYLFQLAILSTIDKLINIVLLLYWNFEKKIAYYDDAYGYGFAADYDRCLQNSPPVVARVQFITIRL